MRPTHSNMCFIQIECVTECVTGDDGGAAGKGDGLVCKKEKRGACTTGAVFESSSQEIHSYQ